MPKIQQLGPSQHAVTIPQQLLRAMGWKKGDTLKFTVKNSRTLELKEVDNQ